MLIRMIMMMIGILLGVMNTDDDDDIVGGDKCMVLVLMRTMMNACIYSILSMTKG